MTDKPQETTILRKKVWGTSVRSIIWNCAKKVSVKLDYKYK